MSTPFENPFRKHIKGPNETNPEADVELARVLLGDKDAEAYRFILVRGVG